MVKSDGPIDLSKARLEKLRQQQKRALNGAASAKKPEGRSWLKFGARAAEGKRVKAVGAAETRYGSARPSRSPGAQKIKPWQIVQFVLVLLLLAYMMRLCQLDT